MVTGGISPGNRMKAKSPVGVCMASEEVRGILI